MRFMCYNIHYLTASTVSGHSQKLNFLLVNNAPVWKKLVMASFTHNLTRVKAASGCVCGAYVVLSVVINPTSHYIGLAPATHAPSIQPLKHRPIPPSPIP